MPVPAAGMEPYQALAAILLVEEGYDRLVPIQRRQKVRSCLIGRACLGGGSLSLPPRTARPSPLRRRMPSLTSPIPIASPVSPKCSSERAPAMSGRPVSLLLRRGRGRETCPWYYYFRISCFPDKISRASSRYPVASSRLPASQSEGLVWRSQHEPRCLSDWLRAPGYWLLGLRAKPALCPLCPFSRKFSALAARENAIRPAIPGINHPDATRGRLCPVHTPPGSAGPGLRSPSARR